LAKPTDSNLVFRALIVLGLIVFALFLAAERGLLATALDSDKSYISYVILAAYGLASAHWLWLAYSLGEERKNLAALERSLDGERPDLRPFERGLVGEFLRDWRDKGSGDHGPLLTAFGDRLVNRHALGHFTSDALLKLGLLGTLVGFIWMLLPVAELSEFDAVQVRGLLTAMSGGMAVALYTTIAGLVTSTLLKLQYYIIDASAADLATRLAVLADVHLQPDAT
jgi:hypothetical protein